MNPTKGQVIIVYKSTNTKIEKEKSRFKNFTPLFTIWVA